MAVSKEFHDYILENLKKAGDVATRSMMGGYCVYFQGKLSAISAITAFFSNRWTLRCRSCLMRSGDIRMKVPGA